jgi:SAM-dependent methyltransferase
MKTALSVNLWQTAADVVGKTTAIHRESGFAGLAGRLCRRLAAPVVRWGGITFFERRLEELDSSPAQALEGITVRQLYRCEIDSLAQGGDPTQDVSALDARFLRGDRAFGAVDAEGRVCHVRWVSTTRVHIPEIDRDIILQPGHAYFYNGYTRPDARKRGIDGVVRNFIFRTLQAEGYRNVCSYVRLENPDGLRAASRWQRPIGTVRYIAPRYVTPLITGASTAGLPMLVPPADQRRVQAWQTWFDSWAAEPLAKRSTGCAALDKTSFRSAASFIDSALALSPHIDTVLDVGCDSAMVTRLVAPRARRLMGIDFIHKMLKDSHGLQLSAADGCLLWFVTADACRLPVRSGAFTKVYCSAMLHTLPTRSHGLQAIDELIRVTARGGAVLVSSVPDRAKRLAGRVELWRRANPLQRIILPVRWLLPRGIKRMARRALHRPDTGLPEFLDYDLQDLARSLETRGLRCKVIDFPANYWSSEFRLSRSNLLISIP